MSTTLTRVGMADLEAASGEDQDHSLPAKTVLTEAMDTTIGCRCRHGL